MILGNLKFRELWADLSKGRPLGCTVCSKSIGYVIWDASSFPALIRRDIGSNFVASVGVWVSFCFLVSVC